MEGLNEYSVMLLELVHARMGDNKEQLYAKLYEAITGFYKKDLIKMKPLELSPVLNELILFYQAKEEYEKCNHLNQVGFEIYNTISD
jgi:hypothetical protein